MKRVILFSSTLFILTALVGVIMTLIFVIAPIPPEGLYAQILKFDFILSFAFAIIMILCGAFNELMEKLNE
jgi:hypothetical protein